MSKKQKAKKVSDSNVDEAMRRRGDLLSKVKQGQEATDAKGKAFESKLDTFEAKNKENSDALDKVFEQAAFVQRLLDKLKEDKESLRKLVRELRFKNDSLEVAYRGVDKELEELKQWHRITKWCLGLSVGFSIFLILFLK